MNSIHFPEFLCNEFIYGISILKFRNRKLFNFFPETVYPGPRNYFLHFAKQFMSIINPGNSFKYGNTITGKDGIQVNCADQVGFFKEKVPEEAEVIFDIKPFPLPNPRVQSFLVEWLGVKGNGILSSPTNQLHCITRIGQGSTDANHTLIIAEVISYCEN